MFMVPLAGAEKNLLRAVQKDPEASNRLKSQVACTVVTDQ
jgi:hypothetical protein